MFSYHKDHSASNLNGQEDCNEKYEHLAGLLVHGMQPNDHDDLCNILVEG